MDSSCWWMLLGQQMMLLMEQLRVWEQKATENTKCLSKTPYICKGLNTGMCTLEGLWRDGNDVRIQGYWI